MKKFNMIQAGLFALLVGGAPFAFAGGGDGDDPVSSDECRAEWNQSSAEDTCATISVDASGQNDCRVIASCKKSDMTFNYDASITVHLNDMDDLANCDGNLRVGGC